MAYAAVFSLKHTIERLLNSSHILLVPTSPEIIQHPYHVVKSFNEILEKVDISMINGYERLNALEEQIRVAVYKLEDVIESHVLNQIISQSEDLEYVVQFSIDLQDLKQEITFFTETLKLMEEEYVRELDNPLPDDDVVLPASIIDFGGKTSTVVGLSNEYNNELKDKLIIDESTPLEVVSLVGMAGIGKTTLARDVFEDPSVVSHFECRAWVTVGRKCLLKEILRCVRAQVEGDEKSLEDRRYLIVLDDLWDSLLWKEIELLLPKNNNGSRVLVTTRLQEVANDTTGYLNEPLEMCLLTDDESWDLLREKVFGQESCPPQLEKAGKKIAEYCEGLPLTIVTVASLLLKAEKTPEFWSEVAARKKHKLFIDAHRLISKVLYPSYEHLPQHLKVYFLYMGVFPLNYETTKSKLINMWVAEGFPEPYIFRTSNSNGEEYLKELISNNVVMLCRESTVWHYLVIKGVKTCKLHSSMWHLCNIEARKNKFFHVLDNYFDGLEDGIKSQRRLCIHNNVLFGIKDVYDSMEDNCESCARSLLCLGPFHPYPVPLCFNLRLLTVLDALTIRFYEFPIQVLKLVLLRYLAVTCNGKLPTSISKLCNLQFFIVGRYMSIKSYGAEAYLPVEIWDMKDLTHLQIFGSYLRALPGTDHHVFLPNLRKLLDVSGQFCSKSLCERAPNLKKLGIRIELSLDNDTPSWCYDHISHLTKLESLKCDIVNPVFGSEPVLPHAPFPMFPSSLRKLSLSGMGYPWEYMNAIASLRNLEVLKLRHYAFRGPTWIVGEENGFPRLNFLIIEDSDFVQWKVGSGSFRSVKCLSINHCYKLREIHWESDVFPKKIEIVDCNPLAVACAKQIKETASRQGSSIPFFNVRSSWEDHRKEDIKPKSFYSKVR